MVLDMTYKTTKLDTFVTLQRGYDLPAQDRIQGDIPVIAANGHVGFHNVSKVSSHCVVLGRSGSIGNPRLITEPFWPLNTTLFVKDFHGNSPTFVYYVLKTIDFKSFDAGGTVPTLNRNHITQIDVPLVDAAHQEVIAGILGNLDSKIAANEAIAKTLADIAQTIFKSWFIDFDPVKAKMAGQEPVGMDAEAAALFPDSMEKSDLGDIPSGWETTTVEEFSPFVYGKSLPAGVRVAGGIPVYGSNGIVGSHDASLIASPTVVVGRKGTVGTVHLEMSPSWIIDTAFYTNLAADNIFLAYLSLRSLRLDSMNSDAAVPGLNRDNAHRLRLTIATPSIRFEFTKLMKPIFELRHQLLKQSETLGQVRDSLLPRIMSGELEIPDDMLTAS